MNKKGTNPSGKTSEGDSHSMTLKMNSSETCSTEAGHKVEGQASVTPGGNSSGYRASIQDISIGNPGKKCLDLARGESVNPCPDLDDLEAEPEEDPVEWLESTEGEKWSRYMHCRESPFLMDRRNVPIILMMLKNDAAVRFTDREIPLWLR